jgi:hypothetical protein
MGKTYHWIEPSIGDGVQVQRYGSIEATLVALSGVTCTDDFTQDSDDRFKPLTVAALAHYRAARQTNSNVYPRGQAWPNVRKLRHYHQAASIA